MFEPKLNRQIFALFKMTCFGFVWNLGLHSVTVTLLVYWVFSTTGPALTTYSESFNAFWHANQLIFATLCQFLLLLVFRDEVLNFIKSTYKRSRAWSDMRESAMRGFLFAGALVLGMIALGHYEFLGLSSSIESSFLTSYLWLFRILLLASFLFLMECFLQGILLPRLPPIKTPFAIPLLLTINRLMILWIWLDITWAETMGLALIFSWIPRFFSGLAFSVAFLSTLHAGFGLKVLDMDFSGLMQLKRLYPDAARTVSDAQFLETPSIQITLLILWIILNGIPYLKRLKGKSSK